MNLTLKKTDAPKGFTLLELLVSIAIFAFMTAFLLAKYGTFNQSILLTNLAYDTALSIKTAQSYGLNVQGTATTSNPTLLSFNYPYGVHFDAAKNTQFILFIDLCGDGVYRPTGSSCPAIPGSIGNEIVSTYTVRTGFTIGALCAGSSAACSSARVVDISFRRPNPDAIIVADGNTNPLTPMIYSKIVLSALNATTSVVVQKTGQIGVSSQ